VIAFAGVLVLVSVLARAVVSIFQGRNQVLKGWTGAGEELPVIRDGPEQHPREKPGIKGLDRGMRRSFQV
jgi:hypothetical protein